MKFVLLVILYCHNPFVRGGKKNTLVQVMGNPIVVKTEGSINANTIAR